VTENQVCVPTFDAATQKLLNDEVTDFGDADEETLAGISNFNWLWPVFEAKYFDSYATGEKVRSVSSKAFKGLNLDDPAMVAACQHFHSRYVDQSGSATYQLRSLFSKTATSIKGTNGDVQRVAHGLENDIGTDEWFVAIVFILFRLRNRLFHGVKGGVGFNDQKDNFVHANSILIALIRAH
jgi:hypothetical protein